MDTVYIVSGCILLVLGTLGCLIPVLPGPPIAYLALILAHFVGDQGIPTQSTLMAAGLITAVVIVLDYIVPTLGAKKFHCSRAGMWGCFIGTVVGLLYLPFGVIVGSFVGALLGEVWAGKLLGSAIKGALGAFLGYLAGIFLKLACCGYLAFVFWQTIMY